MNHGTLSTERAHFVTAQLDHVEHLKESTRKEYGKLLKKQEKGDDQLAAGRAKIDAKKREAEKQMAILEDIQAKIAETKGLADE